METKKDIGTVLNNKLGELKDSPDAIVWVNIKNELVKQKRRKWLRIIILFLLSFTFGFIYWNNSKTTKKKKNNLTEDSLKEGHPIIKKSNLSTNKTILNSQKDTLKAFFQQKKEGHFRSEKKNSDSISVKKEKKNTNITPINSSSLKTNLTHKKIKFKKLVKQVKDTSNTFIDIDSISKKKNNNSILVKKDEKSTNIKPINTSSLKTNSTNEKIEFKKLVKLVKDTTNTFINKDSISKKKNKKAPNVLQKTDSILKTVKKDTINLTKSKWSITVNAGVNYFSSITKGNAINENLFKNAKDNNLSHNFGFYVNYRANEKITLRIGLQYLQMQHRTKDIKITGTESQLYSFSDINHFTPIIDNIDINSFFNNDTQINITQKISYLEIPIELKHKIFNGKIDLIAGFSALHQKDNALYGDSSSTKISKIGTTNNISKLNFSFNFGLSTQFELNKKFSLGFELNYKQYLNTYINNGNNLNPFIISLQTGLTYQF